MKMELRGQDRNRFKSRIFSPQPIFSNVADPGGLFCKIFECLLKDIGSIHRPIGPLQRAHPKILSAEVLRPFQFTKTRLVALNRVRLSYAHPLGHWCRPGAHAFGFEKFEVE